MRDGCKTEEYATGDLDRDFRIERMCEIIEEAKIVAEKNFDSEKLNGSPEIIASIASSLTLLYVVDMMKDVPLALNDISDLIRTGVTG